MPIIRLPLPHSQHLAEALGAFACLAKPMSRDRLEATLSLLDRPVRQVLLVDDDPDFARLVTRMLRADAKRREYAIRSVHTGQEAVELMATLTPDLVLLDLSMPDLKGDDVLAIMRSTERLAEIPVIVVSGQDQLQTRTPPGSTLTVTRAEGFQLDEVLGAVQAILGALQPPREYLSELT